MYLKDVEILTKLKKTSAAQPTRRIKFIERFLGEDSNFQRAGLFYVEVRKVSKSTIQHAEYVVDPAVFEQSVAQLVRHPQLKLHNVSRSCYANSACQALLAVSAFRSLLTSDYYTRLKTPVSQALALFMKAPDNALDRYLQTLQIFGLSPYNQSDATELFYKLLNHLHEAECQFAYAEVKAQTTAIDQLFSFVQQQEITCQRCKGVTTHQFLSRSCFLPVRQTMKKAFREFLRGVEVSGFSCEFCGKDATIIKQQQVVSCARVFVVQLQRWNELGYKVNSNIYVPEFLDLSSGVSSDTIHKMPETTTKAKNLAAQFVDSIARCARSFTHRLKAVICHSGVSVHSGHYVCYVFSKGWQLCDDEAIISCKFEDISFNEAVLLIYETQGDDKLVMKELQAETRQDDFGERIEEKEHLAREPYKEQEPAQIPLGRDEFLDQQALHSDLLHAKADEMDADIDRAKQRKTYKDRDRNRAIREEEIRQRRAQKYQKWVKRERFGKFGTKKAVTQKKGKL